MVSLAFNSRFQNLEIELSMVEDAAVKSTVNALVNVVLETTDVILKVLFLSKDVGDQSKGSGGEVTAGFSHYLEVLEVTKLGKNGLVDDFGHLLKGVTRTGTQSRETSSDVEHLHRETHIDSPGKDLGTVLKDDGKCRRRLAATAHMEAGAHNLHVVLLSIGQHLKCLLKSGAELGREFADGVGVVRLHADLDFGILVKEADFLEFGHVVSGHPVDSDRGSVLKLIRDLEGVSKDDSFGVFGDGKNVLDLLHGGTVKVGTQSAEGLDDPTIRVGLDCVVRKDCGKVELPAFELGSDVLQMDKVEGVLLVVPAENVGDSFTDGAVLRNGGSFKSRNRQRFALCCSDLGEIFGKDSCSAIVSDHMQFNDLI